MSSKFKFLWEPWARLQTLTAESFILIGAVILLFYNNSAVTMPFLNISVIVTNIAKYGHLVMSCLIIALEWPLFKLPILWTNYYFKGLILIIQAAAAMLTAPTHPGGFCLFCAGLAYIVAAYRGESAITKNQNTKKR